MQQLRCAAPPPGGPRGAARGYLMSAMSQLLEDMNNVLESSPPALVDVSSSESSAQSSPVPGQIVEDDQSKGLDLAGEFVEFDDSPVLYAVDGVYPLAIQSSALDYFEGVVAHNPGMDYVAFRDSRDTSVLFYGDSISYSNGRFIGSGNYVRYNGSYDTQNPITRGTDSLSIGSSGYIYSNLDRSFAAFPSGEVVTYGSVVSVCLCVCIGLWIVQRIFFRR